METGVCNALEFLLIEVDNDTGHYGMTINHFFLLNAHSNTVTSFATSAYEEARMKYS